MTSDKDITGQARKMGRNAGLRSDGTLDSVHSHSGTEYPEGTLSARTTNPDVPGSAALDKAKKTIRTENFGILVTIPP